MFVQWNEEKYSVGITTIDNQHRELFRLINEVHKIMMGKYNKTEAYKVVKQLHAYTGYHFSSEESVLREYGYPGLDDHINGHRTFKSRIKNELENVRLEDNYPLAPLQSFLVDWIVKHIEGEDRDYARFFRESAINPELHFSPSGSSKTGILDKQQLRQIQLEIAGIDNQHKELIAILQQANDLLHTSENRRKIYVPVIIRKLYYYSQYHFSFEEEHMKYHSYPLLQNHKELHKAYIGKIHEFIVDYQREEAALTDKIVLFLKKWIVSHILNEDKKYKNYLLNERNSEE